MSETENTQVSKISRQVLEDLGIEDTNLGGFAGTWIGSGPDLDVYSPIDGSRLATVTQVTEDEYDQIVTRAQQAFLEWRKVPARSEEHTSELQSLVNLVCRLLLEKKKNTSSFQIRQSDVTV